MKRAAHWNDDGHSSSDSDTEDSKDSTRKENKHKTTQVESGTNKRKGKKGIDLDALRRHGYKGGLSVMGVPPPRDDDDRKQDWSWSKGQESRAKEPEEESYADRQKTRTAILHANERPTLRENKRELSFSQKEKRKRDLGQSSRGKNYVEEEKRLLRESGFYSGFDS